MEEIPSLNMPVQRLKLANLPLDLPCPGPVTHSREVLTTGKSHGKKPDRRTCEPNLLTNNYLISFECTTITREMSGRYYKLVLNGN